MSDKGNAIRFVKGKYAGETGWLNQDKAVTKCKIHVIVDKGDQGGIRTCVDKTSVGPPHREPQSFEEALLQQHPETERTMNKLVRLLARCNIVSSTENISLIFNTKLNEACVAQEALGSKATWSHVVWEEEEEEEEDELEEEFEEL
jgi:hypothetical protein